MGSLMAGWNSPVPDLKYAKHLRNRSFTNAEIQAYWRLKKRAEEEHLRTLSGLEEISQESGQKESGARLQQSHSLPPANARESLTSLDSETDPQSIIRKTALWTRSNWAFLNEPPVIITEAPSYKYASHYHITNFGSSKTDTTVDKT